MPFTGGSIALVEGDELVVRAAVGPFVEQALGQRVPRDGGGPAWSVVETGQTFLAADRQSDGTSPTTPVRAFLAVPLEWRGERFGLLEIDSTMPNQFGPTHQRLVEQAAVIVSGAVELARRYQAEVVATSAAESARRRLAFLAEASAVLTSSLDHDLTLQRAANLAVPFMADWCTVYLADAEGIRRVAVAYADPSRAALAEALRRVVPGGATAGLVPRVIETGQAELVPDVRAADPGTGDTEQVALRRALGFRSSIVVPLAARGQVFGALALHFAESGRSYDQSDLELAGELAHRCAVAIDNARLHAETQEAVRARDDLLAAAVHDVKNPLAAAIGRVQLLERRLAQRGPPPAEELARQLAAIHETLSRATALVEEVRDAIQLRAGQTLDLVVDPTDLVELAEQAVAECQHATRRQGIQLRTEGHAIVGLWDRRRLLRVLANLLENAVKYSPDDSEVVVSVACELGPAGEWARIEVADRGIGIPAADLPRVFERFYRGGNVAGRVAGTGIGLAGARRIVEQHGGRIEVASREGGGTTFTVHLPLEVPPAPTKRR